MNRQIECRRTLNRPAQTEGLRHRILNLANRCHTCHSLTNLFIAYDYHCDTASLTAIFYGKPVSRFFQKRLVRVI